MSLFSKNKIFQDSAVCAVLDRLMYEIVTGLPGVMVDENMCLTGRAAAVIQGAVKPPCENLVFITNSPEIYQFIQNKLPKLVVPSGLVLFKQRTLYYYNSLYIEFWYTESAIDSILVNGIYVQNLIKIPTATL